MHFSPIFYLIELYFGRFEPLSDVRNALFWPLIDTFYEPPSVSRHACGMNESRTKCAHRIQPGMETKTGPRHASPIRETSFRFLTVNDDDEEDVGSRPPGGILLLASSEPAAGISGRTAH